jgi:hypothetical protein
MVMDIEKPITCKHDTLLVGCVACTEIEELQSQLETTQRELTAATISWENALAELQQAREQEPVGLLVVESAAEAEFSYYGHMNKGHYCLYTKPTPVPAMPIPKQEPVAYAEYQGCLSGVHVSMLSNAPKEFSGYLYDHPAPAQAAAIPEKLQDIEIPKNPTKGENPYIWIGQQEYVRGWNNCRDAMLSAAPAPGEKS